MGRVNLTNDNFAIALAKYLNGTYIVAPNGNNYISITSPKTYEAQDDCTGSAKYPFGFYVYVYENGEIKYQYIGNTCIEENEDSIYYGGEVPYTLDKFIKYGMPEKNEEPNKE